MDIYYRDSYTCPSEEAYKLMVKRSEFFLTYYPLLIDKLTRNCSMYRILFFRKGIEHPSVHGRVEVSSLRKLRRQISTPLLTGVLSWRDTTPDRCSLLERQHNFLAPSALVKQTHMLGQNIKLNEKDW